jgi:hypothetical protein
LQRKTSGAQFGEFVAHRSVYHLKEADPHGWALVEIQAAKYGGGRTERTHSELFRATMRSLGSDDTYGHFVDDVPAVTLAVSNLMSLFGMNRRRLGGDPVLRRARALRCGVSPPPRSPLAAAHFVRPVAERFHGRPAAPARGDDGPAGRDGRRGGLVCHPRRAGAQAVGAR